jgi:Phosphoglucomutase/phosphomannomutase, C-terminal domain
LQHAQVQDAIAEGEKRLNGAGRLVVRPSGTEPLVRIMAEGDNVSAVRSVIRDIADAVESASLRAECNCASSVHARAAISHQANPKPPDPTQAESQDRYTNTQDKAVYFK